MDDCRDDEGRKLRDGSDFLQRREEPNKVKIDVIVEPIMHNNVPFTIIRAKLA
jgi:hypothetical protein